MNKSRKNVVSALVMAGALAAPMAAVSAPAQAAPTKTVAVKAAQAPAKATTRYWSERYTMVKSRTGGVVKVRQKPSTNSRVLGFLSGNRRTILAGEAPGGWYRVQGIDGDPWGTAYVAKSAVKVITVVCNPYGCYQR